MKERAGNIVRGLCIPSNLFNHFFFDEDVSKFSIILY